LVFVGSACLAFAASAAEVYRTVDEAGHPSFSDRPSLGSERIEIRPVPRVSPAGAATAPSGAAVSPAPAERKEGQTRKTASYSTIEIVSPGNDAAIRSNAGNVTIGVHLEPELAESDRVQVVLDGKPFGKPSRNTVNTLSNLDRGTHRLQVRILDGSGRVLGSGSPIVFHLLRAAVLRQPSG